MPLPLRNIKAIWRDQIFWDVGLTASAFKVGYAMGDYITMANTESEYRLTRKVVIFPSQARLKCDTGFAIDTVRVAVAQLIARGHLRKLRQGNQISGANRYGILILDQKPARSHHAKFRNALT